MKEIIKNIANVREVHVSDKSIKPGKKFEHGEIVLGEVLKGDALLREVIRKIQMLRKEAGLKVTEKISLTLETDKETEKTLNENEKEIFEGVGAGSLKFSPLSEQRGELEFEGAKIRIWFEAVK
jgi:valyl-tRNA synthetase